VTNEEKLKKERGHLILYVSSSASRKGRGIVHLNYKGNPKAIGPSNSQAPNKGNPKAAGPSNGMGPRKAPLKKEGVLCYFCRKR